MTQAEARQKALWNRLPQNIKDAIQESVEEGNFSTGYLHQDLDEITINTLKDLGYKVYTESFEFYTISSGFYRISWFGKN